MDLLTQAVLGGALAQSAMRRTERTIATVTGLLAGVLADADILIRSATDPLLTLEYHRHFTHSLIFIPLGALLAAGLCWFLFLRRTPFLRVYLYCLLGYSMSGLLDACTSYGTHLFWPFLNERIAWHIIAIVDPVFTLCLLTGVIASWWRGSVMPARIALALCIVYLGLGALQLQRAEDRMFALAESRGHSVERQMVKPTLGNLLLWRSVYLHDGDYYTDAIRTGLTEVNVYQGQRVRAFEPSRDLNGFDEDSVQAEDVRRFQHFSDGFLTNHPLFPEIIGDIRYSMEPDGAVPLWGIEVDPAVQQFHVQYRFFREQDRDSRSRFIDMLFGRPVADRT